jgi:hypothetical protein
MSTTGPAFHDSSLHSWDSHRGYWQDVLNELPIPPRHLQHDCWVPVTARIVWERDGLERLDTVAYAWFGRKVLVEVLDHRRDTHGVWLHTSDVHRRRSAQQ